MPHPDYDPQKYHRRSLRLPGHDYTQPGAYIITLVAADRVHLFGSIVEGQARLNAFGQIVSDYWQFLPNYLEYIQPDASMVMPDHFHGIVLMLDKPSADAAHSIITASQPPKGTLPGSLGAIVQNFKSVTARRINALRQTPGAPVWQRNYHEHIGRDPADIERSRLYILQNPRRWEERGLA